MAKKKPPREIFLKGTDKLSVARQLVRNYRSLPEGCICPCCGAQRVVKTDYMNEMYAKAVRRLVQLAGSDRDPVYYEEWWQFKASMHTRLKHWGLIVQAPSPVGDPDKPFGKSGYWRPTVLAVRWLQKLETLPSYVLTDNNKVIGVSPDAITFAAALKQPWNPNAIYGG